MTVTKWRRTLKKLRISWHRMLLDDRLRATLFGICLTLFLLFIGGAFRSPSLPPPTSRSDATFEEDVDQLSNTPARLFIAIGSAPNNFQLRQAARSSWLRWLPQSQVVSYRFFTDAPPPSIKAGVSAESRQTWQAVAEESSLYDDLVLQPLPTGYGDKEHNAYGRRARYQVAWALEHVDHMQFFLRIDDDSFLCLHRFLYELQSLPRRQFFWGRFWCSAGRSRADENFMLFSRDVVRLLADDAYVGKIIPYDNEVTFGWNFGYWSWVLNLTIFDDQKRIDAQQGYLTEFMHARSATKEEYASFCEKYIFAHHVSSETMRKTFNCTTTHMMYPLPVRKSAWETCKRFKHSFIPARHSSSLPSVRIERLT